jgi:hypothetical protein
MEDRDISSILPFDSQPNQFQEEERMTPSLGRGVSAAFDRFDDSLSIAWIFQPFPAVLFHVTISLSGLRDRHRCSAGFGQFLEPTPLLCQG